MRTKKRKSPRGNKIPLKGFLVFISVFLVCSFATGLYLFLKPNSRTPPIIFEEAHSSAPTLANHIIQIDHLLYEALYINGTKEGDVIFSAVRPMQDGSNYWDFTELLVKQANLESIYNLKQIITRKLSEFESFVTFKTKEISNKEIICNIFTSGLNTHRIRIIYDKNVKMKVVPYPEIAIIIDDLGYDKKMAEAFLDADLPLSLSILPYSPFTKYVVKLAEGRGRDIMLHLPMEPKNYPVVDPGSGTLLNKMEDDEIRRRVDRMIEQIPGVKGVNHHMGSSFTESYDKMSAVMKEIKKRGLYYVDSRTTPRTVAYDIAKEIGVPTAKKSLFLDNDLTITAIEYQMERLLSIARYSGSAIGIGHPHHETLEVLNHYKDKLKEGFRVVPVSSLVN